MARKQNVRRKHYIAPYTTDATAPTEAAYLRIAQYITNISPNNTEEVLSEGFYHGDGTPEDSVLSIQKGYDITGYYDPSDEAQSLIADLELKILDDRKVWHKVESSDGIKTFEGVATVKDIVVGGGDANAFEDFSCTITYDKIPEVTGGGSTFSNKVSQTKMKA